MINTEILDTLSEKELLKIQQDIGRILGQRSKRVEKALKEYDLESLKKFTQEYSNEDFCERHGWKIDFTRMSYSNLDFFLYISEFPGFENIKNSIGKYNKTEQAIVASLNDKRLFDFFINHQNFAKIIRDFIPQNYLGQTICSDVLNEIFSLELISPTKKLKKEILSAVGGNMSVHDTLNFIKYFLRNNTYEFTSKEYIKIYTNTWRFMDSEFFEFFKNKFKEYTEINLTNLMEKSFPNFGLSMPYKYEKLVEYDQLLFERTIRSHKMSDIDIQLLIGGFERKHPNLIEKFHNFTAIIVNDFPEHISSFKEYSTDYIKNEFKEEYYKAVNYIDVVLELKEKSGKGKSGRTKI